MNGKAPLSTANDRRDFLAGFPAILYDRCEPCGHAWYLPRSTCPRCGSDRVVQLTACGTGVVHAQTVVYRAPSPELKAIAPYHLIFVDATEGFRMMAHGDAGQQIGDAVKVHFVTLAGQLTPVFAK